jgi:hypothetical protein
MDLMKKLIMNNIKDIICDFEPPLDMPNWKVRLIKEPGLLDNHCDSKHIAIPDDGKCCYLLRVIRPRDLLSCYKVE